MKQVGDGAASTRVVMRSPAGHVKIASRFYRTLPQRSSARHLHERSRTQARILSSSAGALPRHYAFGTQGQASKRRERSKALKDHERTHTTVLWQTSGSFQLMPTGRWDWDVYAVPGKALLSCNI